jgi:hypothetical protein
VTRQDAFPPLPALRADPGAPRTGYPELSGQHPGRWHTTTTAVRLFEAEVLAEVRNVTYGDTESMWVAAITEPDGASGVLMGIQGVPHRRDRGTLATRARRPGTRLRAHHRRIRQRPAVQLTGPISSISD